MLLVSGVTHAPAPAPLRLFSSLAAALYGRPWGARLIAGVLGIPAANFRELFVQTAVQTNPDALRAALAEVHRHPLPDGLAHVAVPTLAVVGAHDSALARRAVPYLVGVMPNAVGYLVPDAGRRWNARRPRLFADMVWAWVERRQAATPLRRIKPL